MGKLSVLGAQRVKALTEMLKDEKKRKLAALDNEITEEQAIILALREIGAEGEYFDLQAKIDEVNELSRQFSEKTGFYTINATISTNGTYSNGTYQEFRKIRDEIQFGKTREQKAAIEAEYRRKEQMLWLCETLEEAKAIVGLEEEDGA